MKLNGYIYCHEKIPWQQVFFSNIKLKEINDALYESCIMCDMNLGYVKSLKPYRKKYGTKTYDHLSLDYWIESKFIKNNKSLRIKTNSNVFSILTRKNGFIVDRAAQLVVIEDKYAYFMMTTYEFWKDIKLQLVDAFSTINPGGCLIDLNTHLFVKKHLQDAGLMLK